ncbi:uncharacterized protein N7482_010104 [Penicillium canariense]|uniref:Uncharacterized protein n=1 Tax=Penicillium canariense TaxID=189055 RepID=A0A9W9HMD4_9EURO|nr:uncharacterized protein N7482_010104 [Penicillium canariense]KAJ5150852.1 hypothetical protein N7482_010104 [Penicillium canariense]
MSEASVEFIRRLVGCQELSESEIHIALTAAGADELAPDGNRKLAQLGLGAAGFLIDFSGALMALSREIAKRTGIDMHLRFDPRPGGRSSGVLALATSALIGAIYLRTHCFKSVARGLYALGILDKHRDKLNLMELFKDEQSDSRPSPSLAGSGPAQDGDVDFSGQGPTPFPEISPLSDWGGLSNFESFYNEQGGLKELFADGLPFTSPRSQSPLFVDSCRPVEARQVLDVSHPLAHREIHLVNLHEVENLSEQFEHYAFPQSVDVAQTVRDEVCQPDSFLGQAIIQQCPSRHSLAKRKNNCRGEIQKRKNKRVGGEFRSSLCQEAEMALAQGLPPPEDTYFSPKIEEKLLNLDQGLFCSLCTFLVHVGGSQSLVALREALEYTRKMGDQLLSGHSRRWVSRDLTNNERFEVIGEIQANETFLEILRWNHILHLYRCSSESVEHTSKAAIIRVSHTEPITQTRTRGNPRKIEVSIVVNRMMGNIFPDLEPGSLIYRRKRREVLEIRKFGQRLHILAAHFGDAIVGLLHFDRSGDVDCQIIVKKIILSPVDEEFENFVKILEESQGNMLREISTAAKPAFEYLLYEDMRWQNLFPLEMLAPEEILKFPKGSQELQRLFQ